MTDLKQLRALCDAATQGEWYVNERGTVCTKAIKLKSGEDKPVALVYSKDSHEKKYFFECETATVSFIAAANPQTVRALIDEVERLRSSLRFIKIKCEEVATGTLHADTSIFGIYASLSQALKEIDDD